MNKTPITIYAVVGYYETNDDIIALYTTREDAESLLAYMTTEMEKQVINPDMCYNGYEKVAIVEWDDINTQYNHLKKEYVFTFRFLLLRASGNKKITGYKHCGLSTIGIRLTSYRDLKNIGDFYLQHNTGFLRGLNDHDILVEVFHTNSKDAYDIAETAVKNFVAQGT